MQKNRKSTYRRAEQETLAGTIHHLTGKLYWLNMAETPLKNLEYEAGYVAGYRAAIDELKKYAEEKE